MTVSTGSGDDDRVKGQISIPNPVKVNVQGTMSYADYKACSTVMTVYQSMVQQLTKAAKAAGISATNALQNMDA